MKQTLFKAHSQGNDFLLLPVSSLGADGHTLAQRLCHRTRGIGADGLIQYCMTPGKNLVHCRLYNSDGSEAGFSGNGFSCLAHILLDRQELFVSCQNQSYLFSRTDQGIRLYLDSYRWLKPQNSSQGAYQGISYALLDVGNPHALLFDNHPEGIVESHFCDARVYPDGINVSFVKTLPDAISLKVHERGVGWTSSCSSGSLAAAIVAHRLRGMSLPLRVMQAGGDSLVEFDSDTQRYAMTLKPEMIAICEVAV